MTDVQRLALHLTLSSRVTTSPSVVPGLRRFPGRRTFSADTRRVLGKLAQLVTQEGWALLPQSFELSLEFKTLKQQKCLQLFHNLSFSLN